MDAEVAKLGHAEVQLLGFPCLCGDTIEVPDISLSLRFLLVVEIDIASISTPSRRDIDHDFDTVSLAMAAGASFVARTRTYHVKQMAYIFQKAILHKGFSVVEVPTQCPTYFGRRNKEGGAVEMMENYKNITTPVGSQASRENPDLIERGIFIEKQLPEYCSEYDKIIQQAMKGK